MKSDAMRKKLPATAAEWEALIAAAPGKDRPLTPREEARMKNAVVIPGGGYSAVREALAKRRPGQRGPQVAPTKQLVSVRYSPEVLAYFRSTGTGWQSRMNEALQEWVKKKTSRSSKSAA